MNYIVLLQILSFFGYVAYVWLRIGVQKSISDSWYQLPDRKEFFVAFAAGTGLPMWAYSVCGFGDAAQFVFALSGFFMFCVGVAAMFKADKKTKYIHYGASGLAIFFALWGIHIETHSHLITYIALGGAVPLLFVKHKLWWIEIWIFSVIILKILFL